MVINTRRQTGLTSNPPRQPVSGQQAGHIQASPRLLQRPGHDVEVARRAVTTTVAGQRVAILGYDAMKLMADAITILSSSWNDANVTAQPGDSADVIAAKHDPMSTFYSSRVAAAGTSAAAGAARIVTMGTPAPTANVAADASAACRGRAASSSVRPSSSRAWAASAPVAVS